MAEDRRYYRTSSEYRLLARERLSGNWGKFALVYLIIGAATMAIGLIPFIGTVVEIILSGPIALGVTFCMIKLFQGESFILEDALEGFKNFVPAVLVYLLILVLTVLWGLLLIIPGFVAAYSYIMSYYILLENPGMAPMDVLRQSKSMMKGHRMDLFILHLTFAGWVLLTILTLGIGSLWLTPYITASTTAFYQDLKNDLEPLHEPTLIQY